MSEDRVYEDYEVCTREYRVLSGTNIKHGKEKVWYDPEEAPIGTLKMEVEYFQGAPHGIYREYHPNGKLKVEVSFDMGRQTGPPQRWDENGNLI